MPASHLWRPLPTLLPDCCSSGPPRGRYGLSPHWARKPLYPCSAGLSVMWELTCLCWLEPTVHMSSQLPVLRRHISSVKLVVTGVFTPQESSNTTNQDVSTSPSESLLLSISHHASDCPRAQGLRPEPHKLPCEQSPVASYRVQSLGSGLETVTMLSSQLPLPT